MTKLFLVSTPIGNLGDLSARAVEILNSVDYILCEDTRRARKLKTHFQLNPPLISLHEHNERTRIPQILERMKRGKKFALISDAGTPLLQDPGWMLVQQMIKEKIEFTAIPGPSAVMVALVLSGFPPEPFTFMGFLSPKSSARKQQLQKYAALTGHTLVFFESPKRIVASLREVSGILGDRPAAVCRELTKLHEEVIRGSIDEVISRLSDREPKGEFTVVLGHGPAQHAIEEFTPEMLRQRFDQLRSEGLSRKDALKKLTGETGKPKNELYDLLMK